MGTMTGRLGGQWGGSGWRLSALAVVLALTGLIVVARLGMKGPAPPAPTSIAAVATPVGDVPTPSVAELPSVRSTTFVLPASTARPNVRLGSSSLESAFSPWPDRYADGIPKAIDGVPVHRLNAALNIALRSADGVSEDVLVGGWYIGPAYIAPGCSHLGNETWCPGGRLADAAIDLGRDAAYRVDGPVPPGSGPRIVRGTAQAICSWVDQSFEGARCQFTLNGEAIIWHGDSYTDTAPIGALPLLGELGQTFSDFDPQPYHYESGCQLPPPAQSYRSLTGDVQLILVFSSTADQVAQADAVTSVPDGDLVAGCDRRQPQDGTAAWFSHENVMVLVRAGSTGPAVSQLLEELSAAAAQ